MLALTVWKVKSHPAGLDDVSNRTAGIGSSSPRSTVFTNSHDMFRSVGLGPAGARFGRNAYKSFTESGLAAVRERDEIYLRIRYTF